MKTLMTFAFLSALSFSAQAMEYSLMVSSCDHVEGDTAQSTHIGSYHGVLPEKMGEESIKYKDGDLEISGTIRTFEGGQRMILAHAHTGKFEQMTLMVRMFEDKRTVASAGFCETKEDEGKLSFAFVTFP